MELCIGINNEKLVRINVYEYLEVTVHNGRNMDYKINERTNSATRFY